MPMARVGSKQAAWDRPTLPPRTGGRSKFRWGPPRRPSGWSGGTSPSRDLQPIFSDTSPGPGSAAACTRRPWPPRAQPRPETQPQRVQTPAQAPQVLQKLDQLNWFDIGSESRHIPNHGRRGRGREKLSAQFRGGRAPRSPGCLMVARAKRGSGERRTDVLTQKTSTSPSGPFWKR